LFKITENVKKISGWLFLPAVILLVFYYIKTHMPEFTALSFINAQLIPALILIQLGVSVALGLIIKYLLEPFGIRLGFKEWFGLSVVTTFYNTITPFRGGMVARALYLKERHNFSYTSFLATMSGIYVVNFFIQSTAGLLSAAAIYFQSGIFSPAISVIFGGFFLASLVMLMFSPEMPDSKNPVLNKAAQIFNGWNGIRKNRKIVITVVCTAFLQLFLTAAGLLISYKVFGIDVSIAQSVFLSSISLLGIVISITPGSLGVAEAITVFSSLALGITVAQSLSAAVLIRLTSLAVIFTLGPVYSYILIKKDKKSAASKKTFNKEGEA